MGKTAERTLHAMSQLSPILPLPEEEDERIMNYVREKLQSKLFLGHYTERRLVDELNGYRDVVMISNAEVEFKRDLLDVQRNLRSLTKFRWIGITGENYYTSPTILNQMCLWTEIKHQPLGIYWFQIKTIQFRNNEFIIKLKCLKQISDTNLKDITSNEPRCQTQTTRRAESKGNFLNIIWGITFIFILIGAIFTGSAAILILKSIFVYSQK